MYMQYDDPEIIWHPRKSSDVTIKNKIPLWNFKRQDCDWIPIKLRIPRNILTLLIRGEKLSEELELPTNILFIPGTLDHLVVDIAGTLKEVATLIQKKESCRVKLAALKESYGVGRSTPDEIEESDRMRLATLQGLYTRSTWERELEIIERDTFVIERLKESLGYEISRKQDLSLPLMAYNTGRIVLKRSDLANFIDFFNNPPPPDSTHLFALISAIDGWLLSDSVLRYLDQPPRGKGAEVYPLTSLLPAALFACRELVKRANGDEALEGKVETILGENVKLSGYRSKQVADGGGTVEQTIAVCLVHRAFSGAWKALGHPGLLTKKPQDIFREYFYRNSKGQKLASLYEEISQRDPALYDYIISHWEKRYLGQPGAAAKAFFPY